jgi:CubicO group peptidase (beta-lactamase class C family)
MDPDKYQQAWRAESSQTRVTVDADLLLKGVQRSQRNFRATIFWRDFREVGVSLLLLPLWFYMGAKLSLPWTWYLTVPALVWVAGFFLVDRMRYKQKCIGPGETLLESVKESLIQLEHQIWLLRNVFWWYLLPFTISILAFFAHVTLIAWVPSEGWLGTVAQAGFFVFLSAFLFAVYGFVYYLNQRAVRTQLEPRRQELLALRASLRDETTSEVSGEYPILMSEERVKCSCSPRRMIVASLCAVALLLIGIGGIVFLSSLDPVYLLSSLDPVYREKSPFAAVRWQQSQPEVKVGDEWFKLVSLNDLPASEIVAFSRRTYGSKWRKRFEEDLVELLTRMGHPPQDTATLVVQLLTSSGTRTLEDVPMTRANRKAIWDAAHARERDEQQPVTRPAVPIDDATLFRARIDEFLNAARTKAGFSGAVIVARGGQPVYQGAFGFSHLESKAPNALDTPFRIASLSKQFTAAAIFRLEAHGELSIDDPVHRHLPEFAELPYREITIHHLLTHTSGLPRSPEAILGSRRWNAMSRAATPVDDYVRLAVQMPLKFEPGTDCEYSNFGYRVLSALIARVSGRDYADFMEQEVFRPLGMKDSGVARVTRPPSESRIAEGLSLQRLDPARQPLFANGEEGRNFGAGYGSGGIYSSASDLLLWDRVLAGDAFLSVSQKTRLFQPIHGNYACGWVVKRSDLDGRLYQMHNGANQGFFSQMMRIPENDLVIIAVGNVEATPAIDEVLEQLFRLCRSMPYQDL